MSGAWAVAGLEEKVVRVEDIDVEAEEEHEKVPVVGVAVVELVQEDQVAVVLETADVRNDWRVVLRRADRALEAEVALLPATGALRVHEAARLACGLASCASSPSGRCSSALVTT